MPRAIAGGIQVEGLGSTDIDNQIEFKNSPSVGGLALELHRRLSKHYGRLEWLEEVLSQQTKVPEVWKFESHVLEEVIISWLGECSGLSIIKTSLCTDSAAIEKQGNIVTGLKLTDGRTIQAKVLPITTHAKSVQTDDIPSTSLRQPMRATSSLLPG